MKLIENIKEKLKNVPVKKVLIVCALVLMMIATVVITAVIASRGNGPSRNDGADSTQPNDQSVFNPNVFIPSDYPDDQNGADDEPITYTDEKGLVFVSNGDGTCYVDGMGSCELEEIDIPTKSPLGDTVTKISASAFSGCEYLFTIRIPSSVRTIETGAFRGCAELVSISVDKDNPIYASVGGVLFSADRSVLICYPSNRAGVSYLLSSDVRSINAYAFEGARNLKKLLYEKNISSFQRINILVGNDILDKMSITCNYVSAK